MFAVFLLILLLLVGGAWVWQRHWFLSNLRQLRRIIDDVTAGQRPGSFVFRNARDFSGMAWRLEHLHEERELLKKEVAEKKFDLDVVLASMVEGVLVVDEKHAVRMVNASFLQMFPRSGHLIGQTILQAVREASVDELIRETLQRGAVQSRELALNAPQAEARYFSVNAVPLKNSVGEKTGVVAVFHDISRLRQLEEVRRDFVANVSHELRTPLSILHGYLENLLEHPKMPTADLTGILQIMSKHSSRLNALLEDLLILARLESRRVSLERRDLDLPDYLRGLIEEWRLKFTAKKVTTTLEVPPRLRLFADGFRLEQALGNLLENALKFSHPGGAIHLSARQDETAVELRVEDGGIGIPPADLPHIFERFYRVEKARSRETGGTGLGLSIVKHIMAWHGGTVSATSQLGQGTVIVLRFPLNDGITAHS